MVNPLRSSINMVHERPPSYTHPPNSLSARARITGNTCATLSTTNKHGRKELVLLDLNKPVTIGRKPHCNYVIEDIRVSAEHCKFHVVPSSLGGVIVSCLDMSSNGIYINDQKIRKSSIIVMDGDTVEITLLQGSQTFVCEHIWKDSPKKQAIFDQTPPQHPLQRKIGRFIVFSSCLGSGSFATVHLAIDTHQQKQVACKSIRTKRSSDIASVMKEVNILAKLKHPNINSVIDTDFRDSFLYIFLQLCSFGDLFTYLTTLPSERMGLCEGEAQYIMYQLLEGVKYLHEKMISHRDLKPENILLYAPGPYPHIQIADFGLARPRSYQETFNVCGTVSYLPPEGIKALDCRDVGYVGMPSDCWAAGCVLYIMLSGYHPFDKRRAHETTKEWDRYTKEQEHDDWPPWETHSHSHHSNMSDRSEANIKGRIVRAELTFAPDPWDALPKARTLVSNLLDPSPLHRATIPKALHSEWIQDDIEALRSYHQTQTHYQEVTER